MTPRLVSSTGLFRCADCREWLPDAEKSRSGTGGGPHCKGCIAKRTRASKARNPDRQKRLKQRAEAWRRALQRLRDAHREEAYRLYYDECAELGLEPFENGKPRQRQATT